MDEDDETISIDHLIGHRCIMNESVAVDLKKGTKKGDPIKLYIDGDSKHFLIIGAVLGMLPDGGYKVSLCNRLGKVLSNNAIIITKKLFLEKSKKAS